MIRRAAFPLLALLLASCEAHKPLEGNQFWLNWGINAVIAVATIAAVFFAVLGDALRSMLRPPKLRMRLPDLVGEPGGSAYGRDGNKLYESKHFYHVHVFNARRDSPVEEVQVFLSRIEERDTNGDLREAWRGFVPMTWRNSQASPPTRSFGPQYDFDLCSVGKDSGFSVSVAFVPYGMNPQSSGRCHKILWLQAQGTAADSPIYRFAIDWDGVWDDDVTEMRKHLVITKSDPPA